MKKGFTLVEFLLYFGLVAIFLFAAINFALQIMKAHLISDNFHELRANVDFVAETLRSEIENAQNIDTDLSIFDDDNGKLALIVSDPAKSPTIFSLTDSDIFMTQGSNTPIRLHSDIIDFTVFRFHRVTYQKAPDQTIIDIEARIPSQIDELFKSIQLHTSYSLRKL